MMYRLQVASAIGALLLVIWPFGMGVAQEENSSLRERLERDARDATVELGSIRERLEKGEIIALHQRLEEYPEPEDFEGIVEEYEEVAVPKEYEAKAPQTYTDSSIEEIVHFYSKFYDVDPFLVFAIIKAESNFDPYAVSPAGARGLMQLMPATAREMGVTDIFDPAQNVAGGTQYVAQMIGLFDGDLELALAAYNAGPGTVKKYGGIPPYEETQAYVPRVLRYRSQYAAEGAVVTYLASAEKTAPNALPKTAAPHYTIHFVDGLTQPAEVLRQAGDYYLISYKGHTARIHTDYVERIDYPEEA